MKKILFELTRPARRFGGDRYEADIGDKDPWIIYVPQSLSRVDHPKGGQQVIADAFEITFEPK